MTESTKIIGFDRPVEREWLDAAAGRIATGASPQEARAYVWGLLEGHLKGDTPNSARGKTATVLSRIWIKPPEAIKPLHRDALECLQKADAGERFALHWAMMMAAYPFFADLAETVGKLGRLNGEVVVGQAIRRTKQVWGDRTTIPPAIQRILRSMAKWGVLIENPEKGSYRLADPLPVMDAEIAGVLVRAILLKSGRGMRLDELRRHAALFPFSLELAGADARAWPHLRLSRQGDRSDFVELADAAS